MMPSKKGLVHTFYYKHNHPDNKFKSIHIEHIYRNDPAVIAMFDNLMESV